MAIVSYQPGDVVPLSGIYKIYHDSHRLMHEATLLKGIRFPRCRQCGNQVKFTLGRAIQNDHLVPAFQATAILEPYDQEESGLGEAI